MDRLDNASSHSETRVVKIEGEAERKTDVHGEMIHGAHGRFTGA
jgi:hypothetical protein